jgi:G3E family GTPase
MAIKSRTPAIEHIVIETSGVALPGAVVQATALLPNMSIDGVIVLADAETIADRSHDRYMGDTILRQLADADLILLNKIDLVAGGRTTSLTSWLGTEAPRARVLAVQNSEIPIELALGLHTERLGARGTGRPHDTSHYETFVVERAATANIEQLCARLSDPALGVLRAKGFVRDPAGRLLTLHVVGSRVSTSAETDNPPRETCLVFIGLAGRLDRDAILSILSA